MPKETFDLAGAPDLSTEELWQRYLNAKRGLYNARMKRAEDLATERMWFLFVIGALLFVTLCNVLERADWWQQVAAAVAFFGGVGFAFARSRSGTSRMTTLRGH